MNRESLFRDLAPFCDIGEPAPRISEEGGKFTIRMVRDARPLKIIVDATSGKVQTNWGTSPTKNHSSLAVMFASTIFGDLRRWADTQSELLKRDATPTAKLIPINARTHNAQKVRTIEEVDHLLGKEKRPPDATEILLIDGPAGIGKTNLIEQFALYRAEQYRASSKPLVLHVKSRGRVLSNLQDLFAFSLQTLRSPITYDQIPVFAKYGLVIIAIDGFDELGDPNGYELAWAQLNELVAYVRGNGTLILSGRDTFIGRQRVLADVNSLRDGIDLVTGLTLDLPTPTQAKEWLKAHQWTDANFEILSISVLLEDQSFALRPVFLKLLGEYVKPTDLKGKHERYLTPLLIDHIFDRESKLFGAAVDAKMPKGEIKNFLLRYMCEVARDMADSQTESIESTALTWIAETALGYGYAPEIVTLIKNRAAVVALLMNDERQGYRAFLHSHLLNYFLSRVTIDAISSGDIPKFVRRNLLGSEFLSVFADVASEEASVKDSKLPTFIDRVINFPHSYMQIDRAIRNVGALVFALLPHLSADKRPVIANFQVDDAVTSGTSAPADIANVIISQLDCRGADLSQLNFTDSSIVSVVANESSVFSPSFPVPKVISLESGAQLSDQEEITKWLSLHGRNSDATISAGMTSSGLKRHPIYRLLGQACRTRQYWLRAEDDLYGKILKSEHWTQLSDVLRKHGFLREEKREASGRSSVFVHIKHKERLLAEDKTDVELANFFADLEKVAV